MAITFEQMRGDLIPAGQQLLVENMHEFVDDNDFNWFYKCIKVSGTNDWTNQIVSMYNTRLWPDYDEQQRIPKTEWDDVDVTELELSEYMESFELTRRYLKYGDTKTALTHVIPKLRDFLRNFLSRGLMRHSERAAQIFFDAFAGNTYTAMDGMPLVHHNHHDAAGHFSNRISLDLSAAALDAAWALTNELVDQHGVPLSVNPDTLVIGKNNQRLAFELLSNTVRPGATNAEKNYWYGVMDKVVVCPWLNPNAQGAPAGCEDWWFVIDSKKATLNGFISEAPHLLDDPLITPIAMQLIGITSMVFGWHDWRGVIGSDSKET